MQRILWLILVVWAGSLWTICSIVAPALFSVLPDRQLAGQTAGFFFRVEAWMGLALGGAVLFLLARGTVVWAKRFDYALVIVAASGPLLSEVALRPLMDAARATGDMARFGLLHGLSALLFAVASIGLLLVVWRLSAAKT